MILRTKPCTQLIQALHPVSGLTSTFTSTGAGSSTPAAVGTSNSGAGSICAEAITGASWRSSIPKLGQIFLGGVCIFDHPLGGWGGGGGLGQFGILIEPCIRKGNVRARNDRPSFY